VNDVCMPGSYMDDAWLNVNETWLTPLAYKRVLEMAYKGITNGGGGDVLYMF